MAWTIRDDDGKFMFEESSAARTGAAVRRGGLATLGLSTVLLIITAPDYIGRYRAEEPVTGLFFVSIFGIAALLGLALAMARLSRKDAFTLLPRERVLVLSRSIFGRARPDDTLDLQWVKSFAFEPGGAGRFVAHMSDGNTLTLWRGACDAQEAEALVGAMRGFAEQNRLSIDAHVSQG